MSDSTTQKPVAIMQDDATPLAMDGAMDIGKFLEQRKQLSLQERLVLVDQVAALLDGLYVHLPVKRAMYAVDPIRRLQLLKLRLERDIAKGDKVEPAEQDDLWFHREMIETLTSVRDLHTLYVLPPPFAAAIAFVPFQIECCFDEGVRKYIVTNIIDGLDWFTRPRDFVPGVEVLQWNDVEMARAVEIVGESNSGSNPDARLARGLARLTIRPLAKALPPDEETVTIRCQNRAGVLPDLRVPWHIVVLKDADMVPLDGSIVVGKTTGLAAGLDYETDLIRSLTKRLYSTLYSRKACKWAPIPIDKAAPRKGIDNVKPVDVRQFRESIQANTFNCDGVSYGRIRLRTFKVSSAEELQQFVAEFARLVELMPEKGLIIDIRDNPGGCIQVGEKLLQLLTPHEIEPEGAQCIATPLSRWLCDKHPGFFNWFKSVESALATRTQYSLAQPLTDDCNDIGQRYYGPVILITSGLCYSTADIFAAGFKDHNIGKVLGVDRFTGAGGAEVLTYSNLLGALKKETNIQDIPFKDLPGGVDLRFAVRRMLRVGENAGIQLEDLGVEADIPYQMSVADLLWDNVDLLRKAVDVLKEEACYGLVQVGPVERAEKTVCITIETQNLVQLDIAIDGWKSPSRAVGTELSENKYEAILPPDGKGETLEIRGFSKDGALVAVRRVSLSKAAPVQD
ncbi:MAG TPA: S41 family peptidase [Candidatus Limnocylindrales bacterium]|nr:S41 family peptidase [Candidatus Limnocylindrales bacterium]